MIFLKNYRGAAISMALFSLILSGCDKNEENCWHGYVEGDFLYITTPTPGILENLQVSKGDKVRPGQPLFAIETVSLLASLDLAKSKYNNLTKGKRLEEINVISKQKDQAEANLVNAERAYNRCKDLIKTNAVSQSDLDEKTALCKSLRAKVEELSAKLAVAKMGARVDEIIAAEQEIIQAKNNLENAAPKARQNGRIEDVYFHPGEFVSAGSPVLSILPLENIKIRFFVSEKMLPNIKINQKALITLDGCNCKIEAKIKFISSKAEFTPPVIYSVGSREKLVFMVEAFPEKFDERLRPGLPVNISLNKK